MQFLESHSNKQIDEFTSLPREGGTGGENPCIDTKDVLKLLIVGDSAARLLITFGARSACEELPKRLLNGLGAARSQSRTSASSTVPEITI
jgi:hypothetical protein